MNRSSSAGLMPSSTPSLGEEPLSVPDTTLGRVSSTEPSPLIWTFFALAVTLGAIGILPVWLGLWEIWTTDPLRSIGMLIVPAAVAMILREWRQSRWELQGTWWGIVPIALSFIGSLSSRELFLFWRPADVEINLLPPTLALYLYGSGVILLFAGPRVWRRAWFPVALLLFAQPVPSLFVSQIDYPLQSFAARTARSFATLIGFGPSNPELLKLMFSPSFGMFIAPGCDGMRGAVGLGYVALIAGYLKRLSWKRWLLYVLGGVFLGHLFNLIRLCALVLYYRVAIGHPIFENAAKQADYLIGGTLFLVAVILFLAVIFRSGGQSIARRWATNIHPQFASDYRPRRPLLSRTTVLAAIGLVATAAAIRAIPADRNSLWGSLQSASMRPQDLNDLLPSQIGDFHLVRAWQEEQDGALRMESAIYERSASQEVTLGIWISHTRHNVHSSWSTLGEKPELRADRSYMTSQGRVVLFDTAFYTDGIVDKFAGNVSCTPSHCLSNLVDTQTLSLSFQSMSDFRGDSSRAVPLFFSLERPHDGGPQELALKDLSSEAQDFLSGINLNELSRRFQ